ncbi:Penicillinase repressor [Anaerobutyricum hallii]|uniref:Penicillinase repressor n=1 Tax=Anaerobutyricum hallii TaxID=39488 RepID=A0A285PSX7_9FIRM|nr:BlaI/MecI/CopY family transcriptional regulator [Anaerobutyricum hallii]SOB72664.1 Penicillinase repressor [Anaerobutyricum hallii]
MIKLTNSEKEVMDVLWKSDQPLTAREIVVNCVKKTWKSSYIHIMINSLLEKEMIQVEGQKRSGKNYARTYKPTMTEDEWYATQLINQAKDRKNFISIVFKELLEQIEDPEKIVELEEEINKKKERNNIIYKNVIKNIYLYDII